MTNLIKADLGRILKKPVLYLFTILPIVQLIADSIGFKKENSFARINTLWGSISAAAALFFTLSALILVFGDEFRSGAMQTVIGHGLSRTKLILAKYFECLILLLGQTILLALSVLITNACIGVIASPQDNAIMMMGAIFQCFLPICAYLSISVFLIFTMWNAAVGFIASSFMALFVGVLTNLLQQLLKVPLYDYWVTTMFKNSGNAFAAGQFDVLFLVAIAGYIVLPLALTSLILRRKELAL